MADSCDAYNLQVKAHPRVEVDEEQELAKYRKKKKDPSA